MKGGWSIADYLMYIGEWYSATKTRILLFQPAGTLREHGASWLAAVAIPAPIYMESALWSHNLRCILESPLPRGKQAREAWSILTAQKRSLEFAHLEIKVQPPAFVVPELLPPATALLAQVRRGRERSLPPLCRLQDGGSAPPSCQQRAVGAAAPERSEGHLMETLEDLSVEAMVVVMAVAVAAAACKRGSNGVIERMTYRIALIAGSPLA